MIGVLFKKLSLTFLILLSFLTGLKAQEIELYYAPITPNASIPYFYQYKGSMYFCLNGQLWKSDGSIASISTVIDNQGETVNFSSWSKGVVYKDKFYFGSSDLKNGSDIWVTDGTSEGTHLFYDVLKTNYSNGRLLSFYVVGDLLYITTEESMFKKKELWVTDGTVNGTRQNRIFGDNSYITGIAEINGVSLWGVNDDGFEHLWITKGKAGVGDIVGFPARGLKRYKDKIFFISGQKIVVSDGTVSGTRRWSDSLANAPVMGSGSWLSVFRDSLYIRGMDVNNEYQTWSSDGSHSGTQPCAVFNSLPDPDWEMDEFYGGTQTKYFTKETDDDGLELWVTDGTLEGTRMISVNQGGGSANPIILDFYKNNVLFLANNGKNGYHFCLSDGTDTGTHVLIPSFSKKITSSSLIKDGLIFNGDCYFSADYDNKGDKIYKVHLYDNFPLNGSELNSIAMPAFPNPFYESFFLKVGDTSLTVIKLFDQLGKEIAVEVIPTGDDLLEIKPLKDIPAGIYILKTESGKTTKVVKN